MEISAVIFYLIAAITIGSALMVVLRQNLVHSALFLVITFIGVAANYLLLNADFLAFVQILVYAGAVSIVIIFGVMLTQRKNMKQTNLYGHQKWIASLVVLAFFAIVGWMLSNTTWEALEGEAPSSTVSIIADLMLNKFVVPFEVAAILLTIAMIGAIIIAKGVKDTP
jgi:NADH:ubiquinone oxidoreductase subunit 6 (subunit J)